MRLAENKGFVMKILHFKTTMALEEGGVVKAVLDLCVMSQHNNEVGLATFENPQALDDWNRDESGNDYVRLHHLSGSAGVGGKLNQSQVDEFRTIIADYDIVHLHSMWSPANPQVAAICTKMGKPYVLSIHGMLDDWCMSQRKLKKVIYMKTWGRNLLRDASAIHCTAQAEYDQAIAWFDPAKGKVVSLPLDLSEFQTLPDIELAYESFAELDRSVPKVLFLSRINYKKGVDRLIKASAILKAKGVKHQLVIAGTGDEPYVQEMKSLAKSEGIEEQTYFLGFASGDAKIALFSVCEVFALPTSQENFGFVLYESLAAGTTLVTTKGVDTWQELEQQGQATICVQDPQSVADTIEGLLANPQGLQERGEIGREWIFKHMNPDRIVEQYEAFYAGACK